MKFLELVLPPPLVWMVFAGLAWWLGDLLPALTFDWGSLKALAALCTLAGMAIAGAALFGFRKHHTTVNPHHPEKTRELVVDGVYRFSRNPMYLGLTLLLTGFCFWLGNPLGFLAVPPFIAYLTRFQVMPEERLLAARFGDSYTAYCHRVRRWI